MHGRGDAEAVHLYGERDRLQPARPLPAAGHHLALRAGRHRQREALPAVLDDGVVDEPRRLDRRGADHDAAHARPHRPADVLRRAHAAAVLDLDGQLAELLDQRPAVRRVLVEGRVDVDDVDPARSLLDPVTGRRQRVVIVEHRAVPGLLRREVDDAPADEVQGGEDVEGSGVAGQGRRRSAARERHCKHAISRTDARCQRPVASDSPSLNGALPPAPRACRAGLPGAGTAPGCREPRPSARRRPSTRAPRARSASRAAWMSSTSTHRWCMPPPACFSRKRLTGEPSPSGSSSSMRAFGRSTNTTLTPCSGSGCGAETSAPRTSRQSALAASMSATASATWLSRPMPAKRARSADDTARGRGASSRCSRRTSHKCSEPRPRRSPRFDRLRLPR